MRLHDHDFHELGEHADGDWMGEHEVTDDVRGLGGKPSGVV